MDEFELVGHDESGQEIYRRKAKAPTNEQKVIKQLKEGAKMRRNVDFLYTNLNPELIKLRHEQSQEEFPEINFQEKEFVLQVISRHPIGIFFIWLVSSLTAAILSMFWVVASSVYSQHTVIDRGDLAGYGYSIVVVPLIILIALVFSIILTRVYRANKMIVTTERLVQYISHSLFDFKKQTIDLTWVEDVSYHKQGLVATIFDYGSIRLSTVGDETTYYFILTPEPAKVASELNRIVLAVKNEYPLDKIN